MSKGTLFEYVVLHHPKPTKEQRESGTEPKSEILLDPKRILAANEKEVSILVARELPAEFLPKLDNIEILVRPF